MRVVLPPVLVGERICRIVAPVASLLEVEEWVGEWWEPSSVTLSEVSHSPLASDAVLRDRGVPPDDCIASEPAIAQSELEALLLTHDPERSAHLLFDGDVVPRLAVPRRKLYPGNAKFRKHALELTDRGREHPERRRSRGIVWKGPWRRATDVQPTLPHDDTPPELQSPRR
jgi:hypothetical protein